MFTTYFIAYSFISFLLLVIGAVVLLRNQKSQTNRTFFYLCILLVAWMFSNYFSNNQDLSLEKVRIANHLVLFFAGLSIVYVLRFVSHVAQNSFLGIHMRATAYVNYFVMLLTLTPLVVQEVTKQGDVYAITFGPLAYLYFGILAFDAVLVFMTLIVGVKRSVGEVKNRAAIILLTLGTWLAINVLTNAVIPLVSGSFELTNLGPLTSIVLAAGFAISIVRYRLFNVSALIARYVGYVLAVVTLSLLYAALAFLVLDHFILADRNIDNFTTAMFTLTAVVMAFTLRPFKLFFDRLTRRVFYRDAYDTQEFLSSFNRRLVMSFGLENLLPSAAQSLAQVLRLELCGFVIEINGKPRVMGTTAELSLTQKELHLIQKAFEATDQPVVTDFILKETQLKTMLLRRRIAIISPLRTTSSGQDIGYLVLGFKKSGNLYTTQDIRLVQIVTSELVIAIQNNLRFEEIRNFNETLEHRVETATRQLRQTNDKLRRLDQTKDDFISMASHQLRTPLTSIKGYISMVLEGDAGEVTPLQKKLLSQAFVSSQRMVYLISDLLNVSRLRTGKFVIEPTPTHLVAIAREEVSQLQETAKSRGIELTLTHTDHFPALLLDETKMRQVIMNFIDNAIYYTPEGGHITVNVVEKPHSIELTVVDDGMGVPKSDQPHLFSKFFRADNAKRARPDGTGLGLFMAKKVVMAQGGAIIFKSQEGKGSMFGFTFAKDKVTVVPHYKPGKKEPSSLLHKPKSAIMS